MSSRLRRNRNLVPHKKPKGRSTTHNKPIREHSDSSSSTGDDDEDAELLRTNNFTKDFLEILPKIAFQHKDLQNPEVKFFNDEESIVDQQKQKEAPLYYKDMVREEVLDILEGEKPIEEIDKDEIEINKRKYVDFKDLPIAAQEKLVREEFKKAMGSIEEEEPDNFLIKRLKTKEEVEQDETEYMAFLKEKRKKKDDTSDMVEKYWLAEDVDEDDKFLRNFVLKKGWVNKTESHPAYEEITEEIDKIDEEHLPKQSQFERKYNFRFEEPNATVIPTFSRNPNNTLRKPNTKRKEKREKQKLKKAREKKQREDQKRRALKQKKGEIFERLKNLKEIIGEDNEELNALNLDEDWNPEEWDKKMEKLFAESSSTGLSDKALSNLSNIDYKDLPEEDEDNPDSFKSFREFEKKKLPQLKKDNSLINKWLDEYYALDYEDMISGIPCRFKYVEVKPDNFGLSTEEILNLDDKELNLRSSSKKLKVIYSNDNNTKTEYSESQKRRLERKRFRSKSS